MKEGSMRGNRRDIKSKRPHIMDMPQKQNIKETDLILMPYADGHPSCKVTVQDLYNEIKLIAIRDGEVSVIDNDNNFTIRMAINNLTGKS